MTHQDAGNFAGKHPPGTRVTAEIETAVAKKLDQDGMTCHTAHAIAEKLGVSPRQIGIAIDLQESRIRKCQLGLFGYGQAKKAVKAIESVDTELKAKIESALVDKRLPCKAAWDLADNMGVARITVANACETLGIRINKCQLGAF